MRIDVSKRAVTFIGSDEPVARTVANGEGILVDLNADGRIIAVEFHERRAKGFAELAAEYDDFEAFMDKGFALVEEMLEGLRRRPIQSRRRNTRRLNEVMADIGHRYLGHHVPA